MFDDRLAEINCGEFEGKDETALFFKLLFWLAVSNGSKGVESFNEFTNRNCGFCDTVMEKHKGKNVLIVTHSANARVINYYFNGKPEHYNWRKNVVKNGGLLTFENHF